MSTAKAKQRTVCPAEAKQYSAEAEGTDAAISAGYRCKSRDAFAKQASALLSRSDISEEITARLEKLENAKIADATEVLQFYTSVMRGEVLDQFGKDVIKVVCQPMTDWTGFFPVGSDKGVCDCAC